MKNVNNEKENETVSNNSKQKKNSKLIIIILIIILIVLIGTISLIYYLKSVSKDHSSLPETEEKTDTSSLPETEKKTDTSSSNSEEEKKYNCQSKNCYVKELGNELEGKRILVYDNNEVKYINLNDNSNNIIPSIEKKYNFVNNVSNIEYEINLYTINNLIFYLIYDKTNDFATFLISENIEEIDWEIKEFEVFFTTEFIEDGYIIVSNAISEEETEWYVYDIKNNRKVSSSVSYLGKIYNIEKNKLGYKLYYYMYPAYVPIYYLDNNLNIITRDDRTTSSESVYETNDELFYLKNAELYSYNGKETKKYDNISEALFIEKNYLFYFYDRRLTIHDLNLKKDIASSDIYFDSKNFVDYWGCSARNDEYDYKKELHFCYMDKSLENNSEYKSIVNKYKDEIHEIPNEIIGSGYEIIYNKEEKTIKKQITAITDLFIP